MFPLRDVNPTRIKPVVTIALIVVSLLVFFALQAQDTALEQADFLYRRAVIACEVTTGSPLSVTEIVNQVCRGDAGEPLFPNKSPFFAVLTSIFLHGSVGHVVFNMWFLWIFGNNVEEAFGWLRYIIFYLVGGVVATAAFVVMNTQSTVPLVGASGAIAAVLGAYAVLFPGHRVVSLVGWLVLPVPAAVFLGIWFILQFLVVGGNVAWEAHVGGFIFGLAAALPFRRSLLRRASLGH